MTTLGNSHKSRTPEGYRVAPTSYAELERAANDLRAVLPKVKGEPYILDGWRAFEQTLNKAGLEVRIFDMSEMKEYAGLAAPDKNLVALRADVYDGLFEGDVFSLSTVVHEIGHIALKHGATMHRGAVGPHNFCEDSEWQAKAITAAVTMPLEACRQARSARQLASMCGTSITAAGYRLDKLVNRGVLPAGHAGYYPTPRKRSA